MSEDAGRTFPSPFSVPSPEGADGWEDLYPYYYTFSEARRDFEEGKFWFFDGMHNPEPVYPFDAIMTENWAVAVNQLTTRVWQIPPSLGIDHRVVNGYLYISPNAITDPELVAQRAEVFSRRAGYYFEHWDEIYAAWIEKATDCVERLQAISFEPLPELEDERVVREHHGVYSTYHLQRRYADLLASLFEMGSYHFEMLNLGYGAYLTFREFCQRAFPGIADRTVARMVAGIDILLFRPDDEVRKLARLAIDLGLTEAVLTQGDPSALLAAMGSLPRGREWLEALEAAKDPWFWYSTGAGYTHTDRAWIDDLRLPLNALRGYAQRLLNGETIERPLEQIVEERERLTAEYRALLGDDDRATFDGLVQLARTVYPYVENHNFYVEHWHHSIFWSKVRELGRVFVAHGFFADEEDIFFLRRTEVHDALYDLCIGWATGTDARGPSYWPDVVRRRRDVYERLRAWTPPPALGRPPEEITEPLTIMLWGITQEVVDEWLGGKEEDAAILNGVAASGGVARGRARVVTTSDGLHDVQPGEILVCRITAPSWAPVFSTIAAAVSDIGGIMAHTAIVSREYGLPAVVGTGFATQRIRTGQLIEVNGDDGVVTLLEEAP
ncbi:PEP-utilizing enzyme [Gaiella occulta]|uniref:PEP-utilizing enzyme n=1 Tax=Gaiella occulta TaxID=1002870 RepID=A0A7M2YXA3_9ACTN|nr:PEP-utilizing enzyme [Gaiella occulta]RDI74752.1 PEP-utilizing enzyme [Gaiella occulta]